MRRLNGLEPGAFGSMQDDLIGRGKAADDAAPIDDAGPGGAALGYPPSIRGWHAMASPPVSVKINIYLGRHA